MKSNNKIACVTGASGMVGQRIVEQLIQKGFKVRVLNRQKWFALEPVEVFCGGLEDEGILKQFVSGAYYMYHCAAELQDESKMWEVNVKGTQRILTATENSSIKYFLYLSSAGVVGNTNIKNVTEKTPCNPVTIYEKTKWEAEKIVTNGINDCSMVVLRPTNIIDNNHVGVLDITISNTLTSRLIRFVRGGECAHIVHAKDVANAAIYFNTRKNDKPECFFVSCDRESLNSFSGLRKIYKALLARKFLNNVQKGATIPLFIPYILRKLRLRKSYWGDVRYSSKKIIKAGFRFFYDTKTAVSEILLLKLGFITNQEELLQHKIKINTLVIIGASGFIGKNLVNKLANRKDLALHVLVQKEEHINDFKNIANTTVFRGTLMRIESLEKLLTPGCTVVNLAYMENETQAKNLLAIRNLSNACKQIKIKRLVHCSTATVVGKTTKKVITENIVCDAKTGYDVTKLKIEKHLIKNSKSHYELAILRPTSVFGPGSKNLMKLADNLSNNLWIFNYIRACISGKRRMNLVCLGNVISAIIFICESSEKMDHEVFIISDDNNPYNNYLDIEGMLLDKLNMNQYLIPRIPFPGFLLSFILKLSGRSITQTQRNYSWNKLKNSGFEKSTTIYKELDRFTEWYLDN